tara:strand:+ start:191 stop:1150 length:960 start_codon:yes stop_codon:yes gene_type:complete
MKTRILFFIIIVPFLGTAQLEKHNIMTHILKSKNLEIHIDSPLKNYNLSRFDWTGKITAVKFKNVYVTGAERMDVKNENDYGKGLYNEFGIERPIGYDEISKGEWFQKIGIGLLKKDDEVYDFVKSYDIQPAIFKVKKKSNKITIYCKSQMINGFSYELKKEIELFDSSFEIKYSLQNTGKKTISTNEYIHNFLAINKDFMGSNYILTFPFQLKPKLFEKTFNPENKVEIGQREITFNNTPNEQFFFSNLSGSEEVDASWELINTKSNIGISEKGSFKTTKVNLWGWSHVVSPELFFDINVLPGQFVEWTRTYNVFEIN